LSRPSPARSPKEWKRNTKASRKLNYLDHDGACTRHAFSPYSKSQFRITQVVGSDGLSSNMYVSDRAAGIINKCEHYRHGSKWLARKKPEPAGIVLSTSNTEAHQEKENLPPAQGKSNLATCSFPDTCLKLPEESFNLRADTRLSPRWCVLSQCLLRKTLTTSTLSALPIETDVSKNSLNSNSSLFWGFM